MRLIDKLPQKPNLDESLVRIITTFLFVHATKNEKLPDYYAEINNPNTLLQIMGNIAFLHDLVPEAKRAISATTEPNPHKNTVPPKTTIISGGINPAYGENNAETTMVKQLYTAGGKRKWDDVRHIPESKIIRRELANAGIHNKGIILESKSTNLKENIQNAKELGLYNNANHISMLTSAENAVRTRATARKILGDTNNVSVMTYTPTIPNTNIAINGDSSAKNFWALNEISQQYVYGELLRVIAYSETKEITLSTYEEEYVSLILRKLQSQQR